MANTVEYILQITKGKSDKNIRVVAKELKNTQKELGKTEKDSKSTFKSISSGAKKGASSLKGLVKGFGMVSAAAAGTAAAYVKLNQVVADNVNEIIDASVRSGIAADSLAGLRLALEGSGRSFREVERGLDKFQKKMFEAAKGTGEASTFFKALKVEVKNADGSFRDVNSTFEDVIDRLSRINDETVQGAALQTLFGRSGTAFKQSGILDDMDKFVQQAKELGPAFDENGIKKAAEFQRGMAELKLASIGALQEILEGLSGEKGIGNSLSALAVDLKKFGTGVKAFFQNMKNAFGGFLQFIENIRQSLLRIKVLQQAINAVGAVTSSVTQVATQGPRPDWAKGLSDVEYDRMVKMGMGGAGTKTTEPIFQRGFITSDPNQKGNLKKIAGIISSFTSSEKPFMEFLALALPDQFDQRMIEFRRLEKEAMANLAAEQAKLKSMGLDPNLAKQKLQVQKPKLPINELSKQQQKDLKDIANFVISLSDENIINIKTLVKTVASEGKKTRSAISKRTMERLRSLVSKGEIKDFTAIIAQIKALRDIFVAEGRGTKELDKMLSKVQKLQKAAGKKTKFDLDMSALEPDKKGGKDPDQSLNEFNQMLENGEKLLSKYRKEAHKLSEKELSDLNKEFLKLVEKVRENNFEFEETAKEAGLLKMKADEIGVDTTNIDQLIQRIKDLQQEANLANNEAEALKNKFEKTKFGISIATDIIGLAGGNIIGGISGILNKTLSEGALSIANPVMGLVSSLSAFGGGLFQAGQTAIEETQRRRTDNQVQKLEEAFGRSLSKAEKKRIENQTRLSESEKRKISEEAMKEKAAQDVKQFAFAIEAGVRMLPEILLGVFPPLFADLAFKIVQAILELPFRIVIGIVSGLKGLFENIFISGPKDFLQKTGDFFSGLFGDSKRSGGRFISARRGLRFTGGQDGLAMLHRNEYVVPESGAKPQAVNRIMNQQSGSGLTININADVVERDAIEEIVRRIERKFQDFGTMQSTLFAG